jgi:RsiW-degrading membrane proteinase PrsW (M82 family)
MPTNASLLAAIIPMIIYLIIIWRMDKYEREPFRFLILHFLWGAFGAIILGILGSAILGNFTGIREDGSPVNTLIQTILFAPVSEEIAKGVFLLWSVKSRKFDNITDGLVYGSAIGLGFGMTENFTYFVTYGDTLSSWIFLVFIRSLFSAVMHMISTATFGAFLGMAKFNLRISKTFLPIAGLLLAIFFHFMWNFTVSYNSTFMFGFVFMIGLIIYFMLIFRYAIRKEKEIIESELNEEYDLLNLPKEHIKIISSSLRLRKGWVDENIRKQYFRIAIRLAFKKMQSKNSEGYLKATYDYEVEVLRNLIRNLFLIETAK